jgi:uncharacterized repeat protein (TIGR01451 family)
MKQSNYIKFILLGMLLLILQSIKAQLIPSTSAIVVNNTPIIQTCALGSYGNAQISVPTEALSGDNILLNITFPATAAGCVKTVKITNTTNLNFGSSVISFVPSGTNTYTNSAVLDPINGQNFNVIYSFPNGTTCNGAVGTFTVEFTVTCGTTVTTCTKSVNVIARAANYWSIAKVFITGNLVCGNSYWAIRLTNNNPNPSGLGGYTIGGTVTETVTSVPIVSPTGPVAVGPLPPNFNSTWTVANITLQNCLPAGATITNTASYNLTLGGGCSTVTGTVSATSTPLQAPNASINFTKSAWANGGIFSAGCQGYYVLTICNNGNVPWSGFTLTDNLSIPGLTFTSFGSSGGWVATPGTLTGLTTFTNPSLVLLPGQCTYIYLYFNISSTPPSTITNTATLTYSGYVPSGSGSGGSALCTSVTCPTINTAVQTVTANTTFTISPAKAVPSIVKCNEPNPWSIPIKQVGNTIKFRIQVGNSGAATLNTVVNDVLNSSPQNLTLIGTPTFTYYANQNGNYCGGIGGTGVSMTPPPNTGTATSPQWALTIPPNCNLFKANVVVIELDALINPQISGSRTNTATATTAGWPVQSGSANYTIDKTGELKIRKVADVTTVENGGTFNYTLTVTNMGSTPLNNVIVTDNLPACVALNGSIIVKKNAVTISSTVSSSVVITINAATVINPGESFVITIPVKKVSGTNCCNPLATATGKMVPDGTLINATTPVDEPACVTSISCCDIQNFETSLNPIPSHIPGNFNLTINAGLIPVQELEISMLDYHVVYSSPDCKPLSMGIFGTIFSPNTTIGGLLINNNSSHTVGWGLGTPTILNNTIKLTISRPGILNLSCCNGVLYFCLKVRVKNVDCKVCEKIVCGKFNLKSNTIIWDPPIDVIDFPTKRIKAEFKELNEKTIVEQQQKTDIEDAKIQILIQNELKKLEPAKAQELLNRLSTNPKQVIEELKGKAVCCPSVPTSSGGTVPTPR